jgi:hypothetical protein
VAVLEDSEVAVAGDEDPQVDGSALDDSALDGAEAEEEDSE